MNYYLARDYKCKRINDAGSKARLDIERIMDRLGFLPAGRNSTVHSNRVSHFIVTLAIIVGMVTRVKWGDKLVLQYPVKYYGAICYLAHMRGVSVITLVHDLGCFRHKRSSVRREIRRMNLSDGLIGCNSVVCKWLSNNGYVGYERKRIIESLGAFDFLSESVSPDRKKTWPLRQILYAGQLAWRKNSFLYQYGRVIAGYTVNIYGKGFDKSKAYDSDKFDLKGFLLPDDLIRYSEGDFGLVWDGDSVDSCSGNWGEYLSINTPHKISLYMRCGLPVIIWSKAAMAGFVEENGIGICVNSLRDISEVYEKITYDDYCLMCDNVQRVSRMMSGGGYLSRAVSKVVSRIGNRL